MRRERKQDLREMTGGNAGPAQNMGGVPEGAAKCIGIGQMLCAAVCVVSAIAAAAELFRHKELWRRILNGLHILCSVCIVTAVLYFEMYQFWGC